MGNLSREKIKIGVLVIAVGLFGTVQSQLLSTDNNDVSLKTFQVLKDSSKGSLIASPFSIRTMLAMLTAGAKGNTRSQILTAMKFPTNEETLFETYREYIQQLNAPSPVKTEISNRVFLKDGFVVQENFQNILKHHFQAPHQQISFEKPKKAAEEINEFVSRKTNYRIQKIVDSKDLSNQTRMVLVNTLYFKGAWENPFPTTSTRRRPFYIDESKSVQVDMMQSENWMKAVDIPQLDAKAVIIPYQKGKNEDDGFEMVIIVPNKRSGLAKMESNFTDFSVIDSLYKAKLRNIELRLPRFSIESSFELVDSLRKMGVTDIFDEKKSDLGGIPVTSRAKTQDSESQLFVSKMLQKAFLNVDEAGSEAGAATIAVVFVPLSIGPPVEEVITVDRPFIGFIRDSRTNTVLFNFRKVD